jgi:hypothetical protein
MGTLPMDTRVRIIRTGYKKSPYYQNRNTHSKYTEDAYDTLYNITEVPTETFKIFLPDNNYLNI